MNIFEVLEIEYREVIKQIPEVEVPFVEKHVNVHRVQQVKAKFSVRSTDNDGSQKV